MAIPLVVNSVTYSYPEEGDVGYAGQATQWAQAVTGAVTVIQTPGTLVASSAVATSCPSGATTIPFVASYDPDSAWATNTYTVPAGKAGTYLVTAALQWTVASAAACSLYFSVQQNGVAVADFGPKLVTTNATQVEVVGSGAILLRCAVADTIKIVATNGVATTRSLSGTATRNFISIVQQA